MKQAKEFKTIGFIKCQICGEMLPVREADNMAKTPWVNCVRCHHRSFFNGTEGQEIRKHLQEGHKYRSVGGLEFLPVQTTQKDEKPVSDEIWGLWEG